jgi:hypothetical protein
LTTKSSLSDVHLLPVVEDSRSRPPPGADVFAANVGAVVALQVQLLVEKMHSPLNSPQLWVQLEFLLTEPIRCPVQLGRWLEFLVQQLTALMS